MTVLSRRLKLGKNGKWRDVGAYIIDMRIKRVPEFAGIKPRLVRTTGVYPSHRNASTIVSEMKLMLKELIRERDATTLRRIQSNALSLPSAYKLWKTGRVHLAEGHEDKRVVKSWREYLAKAPLAETTKVNRLAIIASLEAKKLLSDLTVVNELPDVLKRARSYYEGKRQAAAFNTIRIEVGAFLAKGLGMEDDSPFLREVLRVRPLVQRSRRAHHPFYSPHECEDFCADLLWRNGEVNKKYVDAVLFMCLHGLRPEEFAGRRFAVDGATEHLRVLGTKNANASRIVPLMWLYSGALPPRVDTLNRTFERMGAPVRCRDFRRTFAIWCEAAGIPNSRVQAYMGHAPESVTQTYQTVTPRQAMLDEDRGRLLSWYTRELAKKRKRRMNGPPATAYGALMHTLGPALGRERWPVDAVDLKDDPKLGPKRRRR